MERRVFSRDSMVVGIGVVAVVGEGLWRMDVVYSCC